MGFHDIGASCEFPLWAVDGVWWPCVQLASYHFTLRAESRGGPLPASLTRTAWPGHGLDVATALASIPSAGWRNSAPYAHWRRNQHFLLYHILPVRRAVTSREACQSKVTTYMLRISWQVSPFRVLPKNPRRPFSNNTATRRSNRYVR